MSMTLRETVARAMCSAKGYAPDEIFHAQGYSPSRMWEHFTTEAYAALRAVADAGFVIVPKDPTSAAISAGTKAIMDTIEYENSDGRDIILNPRDVARAALAAAFKTMGR